MIQVGIFTGYFPYGLQEVISRIKGNGFNTVQLDLDFRDMDMSTEALNDKAAKKIRDAFRDANLPICCVSGYTNLVHPDPAGARVISTASARSFRSPVSSARHT